MDGEYEVLEKLGNGLIADVYRGRVRETGEEVAIKIVDLGEARDADSHELAPIVEEIETLARVDCPFLTHYRAAHVVRDGAELWIVAELMRAGSIADIMRVRHGIAPFPAGGGVCAKAGLDEPEIAFLLLGILRGLEFLHSRGVPHAGVKCSNVLVSASGEVKLTDYGVFEQLQHQMTKRDTVMHSPYWMAPEMIAQGEEAPFSLQSDVWALGITALEMAAGRPPRFEEHPMKAIFEIPNNPAPQASSSASDDFRDFVARCLQKDPSARPSVAQLLQHPFVQPHSEGVSVILTDVAASVKARSAAQTPSSSSSPPPPQPQAAPATVPATTTPAAKPAASSTLTAVIYPTLTRLLAENRDSEPVVMSLARIKLAFDSLEKTKPGSVHNFISQVIEALGAHQQKK